MFRRTVSAIIIAMLLTSTLTLAFNIQPAKAEGTIYIRADGSIDPPTTPIHRNGEIYTLTGNIYDPIVVERNNIMIDGAGWALQGPDIPTPGGPPWRDGFTLSGVNGVTIRETKIRGWNAYGIRLYYSSGNNFSQNEITQVGVGIYGEWSPLNIVDGNVIDPNPDYGPCVAFYHSSDNLISRNQNEGSRFGIVLGLSSSNNIVSENHVVDSTVGVASLSSSGNQLCNNTIASREQGISIQQSDNNIVSGNSVTKSSSSGPGYPIGIRMEDSINNIIFGNVISDNWDGIQAGVYYNEFYDTNNKIYHNDFIDNVRQACVLIGGTAEIDAWDDGYPSGGNYWSDYNGTDANSDGIGDTPYIIDADNRDRYPLMNPRARALHIAQPELFVSESWLYVDRRYNGPNIEEYLWKKVVADIEEWSGQSLYKITDEFLKNDKTVAMITTDRTKQWVDLRSSREYEDKTVELDYDPGYKNYEFPLYVGQEWENSANLSQTTTYRDGKVENISYLLQDHQTVISEETITVKAGNFTALKIKVDYGSGLEGYVDYIWFSSDVKNWVKWESYFNNTLVETAELQSLEIRSQPSPRVSLSAWTFHPPTIDGIISNSEWHHAAQVEFVMGNVSGMIYEMNDETNLYLGVKLNESFPDLFKIVFEFDNDNDGHDPMQGDDLIFASYTSEFVGTDAYWDSNRSDFMQDPIHDLQYMVNRATSSVEFSKPLHSSDPHDFALHAGDNVGFQMSYWHSNLELVGSFPGNRTGSGFPGHGTGDHGVHSTFGQIAIAEEGPACGIPVLVSLLEISPGTPYYVGDTLAAEFTIKNVGDAAITLDKLLVGGRFDGGTLPNGLFPDFTNESVTLQLGQSHMYEGALELTEAGNYHFFVAYYIENPTAEEKNLLDENNWNTCVQLGEGLTDADRVSDISVLDHAPPPNQPPSPPTLLSQYRLDGGEIPVKDPVDEGHVKFAAVVEDPDGDQVRLQAELRRIDEYGGQFDETKGGLKESPLFDSGGVATIEVYDLIRGQYHWRARTIDEHGMFSDWYDFGNNDVKEPDFIVCNKFRIVYPEGWMKLQLFVPVGYSPVGYLDKIKFGLQNRKDMWYKITVSRRAPGGSWEDITDRIWKVPYIGPYSAATEPLLYSPIGGEEIRIDVKDDPEDGILWALKVVDILARALTGKPAPPAILDVAGERPLLTFWKDVIFPLGLNYVKGEFWDYVGDLCKAAAEYMIRHDLASVFIDQGFTTEKAAEIISVVNVVAAEGIYALYKLAKFIVVSKDLFSNMGALPNQEENVILTIAKRPTSTVTPNLVLTEGLHVIQEGPYYQGDNIKACFSIKNVGLLAVNLHALTVGGRTEEGYVRDFSFETDVTIDPGETYRYEGELTLLHAGRNCFFVALQVEDDEWVTSVPTKVGLVNNLYVNVEPVQIVMNDNLCSPGELRVYDHQGRVTGLVAGETRCEIPHSFYYDDRIIIFYPEDNLTHCVVGTGDGTYNLEIAYVDNGETTLFNAINLSTSSSAVHEYSIGWAALSRGEEGVTVQIDSNGDGTFEKTFTAGSELTRDEFMLQVFPLETFPMWIAGVAVAAIAIVTIAIAVFWRKRKQPSIKKTS